MPDMLVRLYDLPATPILPETLKSENIQIKRAMTCDKWQVVRFVQQTFNDSWASECDVCFANKPVTCFIAVKDSKDIVGFACYEATFRDYFGPTGVHPDYRGKGLGTILLLHALHGLCELGYGYAVIGGAVDAIGFYQKTVDAVVIPHSVPSIYRDRIKWHP